MSEPIDRIMDQVDWTSTENDDGGTGLPYATHRGVLRFAGYELRCYRLNDGRAVVDADDVDQFFGEDFAEKFTAFVDSGGLQ